MNVLGEDNDCEKNVIDETFSYGLDSSMLSMPATLTAGQKGVEFPPDGS
jgi:hypothetical protein